MVHRVALLVCSLLVAVHAQVAVKVNTTGGALQGLSYDAGYTMFKGIPYAAPPVGSLRWQPPTPAPSWSDVYNATEYGPGCIQHCFEPKGICPPVTNEDCLYLNVWTPNVISKPLAVMVFFPGGNYIQDTASTDLYWGLFLPNISDVVLVTVNYRLGSLAFLYTGTWAQGNLGLKDQRQALYWIQDNIANFGGDPNQVTIVGQSAGADSVLIHTFSPDSMGKNLFHRGIVMSSTMGIPFRDQSQQIDVAKAFGKNLGCDLDDESCFMGKTSEQILAAQVVTKPSFPWPDTFMKAYEWAPVIGSEEVPMQMLDAFHSGNFTPVPLMIGTLLNEGVQFVDLLFPKPMSKVEYEATILAVFGLAGVKILNAYPCFENESTDCRPVMANIATHKVFACPTRNAVRTIASTFPQLADSLYIYFYDHPLSFPGWGANFSFCDGKVCHGSELPVLYNSATSYGWSFQPDEIVLSKQMEELWGAFVSGGTGPLAIKDSNVEWPVYNATDSFTIRLDVPALETQQGRLNTICDMWDQIGYDL